MFKKTAGTKIELVEGSGGVFEITIDGELRYSKRELGRFPTDQEIERLIGEQCVMSDYSIELMDSLPKDIEETMSKDVVAYERNNGVDVNYKRFSLALFTKSGEAFGVLNAYTVFTEVYVDDLWVDASWRGKGYGRKLIQALEDMFKNKGFNNINLVTSAFQAPEFYRKCGYVAEFTRENTRNPKLSKTFFSKYFEDTVQTQGLTTQSS